MKYLLGILVVVLVAWRWRTSRSAKKLGVPSVQKTVKAPLTMVRCGHCGVHIPLDEGIAGAKGVYCSHSHRQTAEGSMEK